MKATIVSQIVHNGMMDFIHGYSYEIKRLVIESKDNLAITPHNNEILVFTGFKLSDGEIIGEVEIPDELVEKALAFIKAKAEFDSLKSEFEALIDNEQQQEG